MIHQHFMLVPAMTVTDNVMLALDAAGAWLRPRAVADRIREVSRTWHLEVDPNARVGDLPLGLQQRVEILKAILRGAELLILDEPTSNLSPPEVTILLDFLRRFRGEGGAVVFISHKLGEVLELCDEVVVLRDGEVVGTRPVAGASRADLARMMVGREVASSHEWTPREAGAELLLVVDLHGRDAAGVERLSGVSFSVRAGEVFAIAGVDGNGQAELAEAIGGLVPPAGGHVYVDGADLTAGGIGARLDAGMAHIPPTARPPASSST
jgi:simple sugar transport system ATP-binding protein